MDATIILEINFVGKNLESKKQTHPNFEILLTRAIRAYMLKI
jgi:hypothetical protein